MFATLETAPTKVRLDQIEFSNRRMAEALDKIKRIGTLTQESFVKAEFVPLKLDFDTYSIRTQYEDEEKEKLEQFKRDEVARLMRKTSEQIFKDKLFNKETLAKIAQAMDKRLHGSMKKLMNKQIDTNPWMKKLVQFYKDEMGSDSDAESGQSLSSSSQASSSSASATADVSESRNMNKKRK